MMARSFGSECIFCCQSCNLQAAPVVIWSEHVGRLLSTDCELPRLKRRLEWPTPFMVTEEVTVAHVQSRPCSLTVTVPRPAVAGLGGHSQIRCIRSRSLCWCISCGHSKVRHSYRCETFANSNKVESVGPKFLQNWIGNPTRLILTPLPLYHIAYVVHSSVSGLACAPFGLLLQVLLNQLIVTPP